MREIISGKAYDTDRAQLIADNYFWDGHNWDRQGRNTFLYRTAKGNFFTHHTTRWQGERDRIEPITEKEALELWDVLPEKRTEYREAFGYEPEEA